MTRPLELVVASHNPGKLAEIGALLAAAGLPVRLLGPAEAGVDLTDLVEDAATFRGNARLKARVAARRSGRPALADDSGLEVDALGGRPGVLSARFFGPHASDGDRVRGLLDLLAGFPDPATRSARFVCVAALADPAGPVIDRRGICRGRILAAPRGRGGFGYDPIFQPAGFEQSFAELPPEVKNRVSHRARAFARLIEALRARHHSLE